MKIALSNFKIARAGGIRKCLILFALLLAGIFSQFASAQAVPLAPCTLADIDRDNDGLIEICNLEGLDAIRYQPDGSGYKANNYATKNTAGCAAGGCEGYELVRDLDFDDDASYSSTANKVIWTSGAGWHPIGTPEHPFNAIFKANGYAISNLTINRPDFREASLFKEIGDRARIDGIGLINVDIRGEWGTAGLVGKNRGGRITRSYVTGIVLGSSSVGGLVGDNYGVISDSYTRVRVSGDNFIGGLVGCNFNGSVVKNSYAASVLSRSPAIIGSGLFGYNDRGAISYSYWDTEVSGISDNDDGYGIGLTTSQLQSPIAPSSTPTEVYYGWSTDTWDFGTPEQYPVLKDSNGPLMPGWSRKDLLLGDTRIEITGIPDGTISEGDLITITASPRNTSSNSIPLIYYYWSQTRGKILTMIWRSDSGDSINFYVPYDYVDAGTNSSDIELRLGVEAYRQRQRREIAITRITITITKRNNGQIEPMGGPSLRGRELTAPLTLLYLSQDPDGSGSDVGYQWQSRETTQTAWANVPTGADTKSTYTIPEYTKRGTQYRVIVKYTDGQGYREEVISDAIAYEGDPDYPPSRGVVSCSTTDIDRDNDGLIEICDLEGLNAMRYQPDGSGYKANRYATKITAGCAAGGCKGYELVRDLDFNDDASYSSTANKVIWTTGAGWQPVGYGYYSDYDGYSSGAFRVLFEGNNFTISNLRINRPGSYYIGLFGWVSGKINRVGLINVDIVGKDFIGGIAGHTLRGSTITNSYVVGGNISGNADYVDVGGIVGRNYRGTVANSYASVNVHGSSTGARVGGIIGMHILGSITDSYIIGGSISGSDRYVDSGGGLGGGIGGIAGRNYHGSITNSYAVVPLHGNRKYYADVGGIVGFSIRGSIADSYWDKTIGGASGAVNNFGGIGKTTSQLQSPTAAVGIYSNWSSEVWDFGTSAQYPVLKDSDGMVLPNQQRENLSSVPWIEVSGMPVGSVNEGEHITLTAVLRNTSSSSVPLNYQWTQAAGKTLLAEPAVGNSIAVDVPYDFVPTSANSVSLVFLVENNTRMGRTMRQVLFTITKRNDGRIERLGEPRLDIRELVAPPIDLSGDPDGAGSDVGYQWQSRETTRTAWANVTTVADTKITYTIPEYTRSGTQYRVVVSYTDGQGYREEVASQAIVYEGSPDYRPSVDTVDVVSCSTTDIDQDNDSLIEICDLEGLNAMRYQPDGSGYKANSYATKITAGCAAGGCEGYELVRDLDFNDDASYSSTANKVIWTTGAGWQPIGTPEHPFNAIFKANGYAISNLTVDRPDFQDASLFMEIADQARIEDVSLINVDIRGGWGTAGLVGKNGGGRITRSYVTGIVRGSHSVGGLVGDNYGVISDSYTRVRVTGYNYVGGLVGCNFSGSVVKNSYTVSVLNRSLTIISSGLLGYNGGTASYSYWDTEVSGISDTGNGRGIGLTTSQLQSPMVPGSTPTEVYYGWSTGTWDFGTSVQYPMLKDSKRRDLPPAPHLPQIEISGLPDSAISEGKRITLTAAARSTSNSVALSYRWTQTAGKTLLAGTTTRSSITLDVPNDYVATSLSSSDLALRLVASSDIGSTAHRVSITIAKRNNGRIEPIGKPSLNERQLTAPPIDLSDDPDGVGGNVGYQWQSRLNEQTAWVNVPGGSNEAYTIPEDTGGIVQYRVAVSYTDGQGYREEVASQAVIYEGNTNTRPRIESPSTDSYIGLTEGQTTAVSVIISEADTDDTVTLTITPTPVGAVSVEPSSISLGATSGEIREAEFQVTALQIGTATLLLTAVDDSAEVNDKANEVELTVAVAAALVTSCDSADIDEDDDGLIEICNLEGLNAMRYQLDGSGYRESTSTIKNTTGCAVGGCIGYELAGDLDFNDDTSYRDIANKQEWTTNEGWQPIGTAVDYSCSYQCFSGLFEGNNYTISNLKVNMQTMNDIGLFGGVSGEISHVGLLSIDIVGDNIEPSAEQRDKRDVGGLVGFNEGLIANSYAIGRISVDGVNRSAGGLVGFNRGSITAAYASGSVNGRMQHAGGLVGYNDAQNGSIADIYASVNLTVGSEASVGGLVGYNWGRIQRSYAIGKVSVSDRHSEVGGLVGNNYIGPITSSYWDRTTSGITNSNDCMGKNTRLYRDGLRAAPTSSSGCVGKATTQQSRLQLYPDFFYCGSCAGKTTMQLQSPTAPGSTATEIYYDWSAETWDFGTSEQYPMLKYSDGTLMPNQHKHLPPTLRMPQIEISGVPKDAVDEGAQVTLIASARSVLKDFSLGYQWMQVSGEALLTESTTQSSITLDVPSDYVAASVSSSDLALRLVASSDIGSTTHRVSITITKRNDGQIEPIGEPSLNERQLTAPPIDLSGDPDGAGGDAGYQWQSRLNGQTAWVNVPGGSHGAYTIPEDTGGIVQYRVAVSYTDGQGYREKVASQAVIYEGNTNTRPRIESPSTDSYIGLTEGQTTAVSVIISEADTDDTVTLTITPTPVGAVSVEPSSISLGATSGEIREAEFQVTALQIGTATLLLTAVDDSAEINDKANEVELTVAVEATLVTSCDSADIDEDDDGLIEICNLEGLNAMRYQLDGSGYRESTSTRKNTTGCATGGCIGYELTGDLDFNDDTSYRDIANKQEWTTNEGWQPIGRAAICGYQGSKCFSGVFEGNNYTISNLFINRTDSYVGLFGTVSGEINNIGLLDVDITAANYVGGLIGYMFRGRITDSYANGNVKATDNIIDVDTLNSSRVGGLVGYMLSSRITDSYAISDVSGVGGDVGGLVGGNGGTGSSISNSYAVANVAGGGRHVGGLLGHNTGYRGSVSNSYAIAEVTGTQIVGGLLGTNTSLGGSVSKSYAVGKVTGTQIVGGLAGHNRETITNSYAVVDIKGMSYIGGLVGDNVGEINNTYAAGTIEKNASQSYVSGLVGRSNKNPVNSYWDRTTSGIRSSGSFLGKTTEQMQAPTNTDRVSNDIYYGWSTEVWDFGTSKQYPTLKSSDGTLIFHRWFRLIDLEILETAELSPPFDAEVFEYQLLVGGDTATIRLMPTASHAGVGLNISSDSDFSGTVANGVASPAIPLNSTSTVITLKAGFVSGESETYQITVFRAAEYQPQQLGRLGERLEYIMPKETLMGDDDNMLNYEIIQMPSWLQQMDSDAGLRFGGTPQYGYLSNPSEQIIKIKVDNGDGTTKMHNIMLEVDSPTTGTVTLVEGRRTIRLDDKLTDENGIEQKIYIWEHCPVGANRFYELEGASGTSYLLPTEGSEVEVGTAYRVRTIVVDTMGQRSEYSTEIKLRMLPEERKVIEIRTKVFLEGFLE